MKRFRFKIDTGYVGCSHEVEEKLEDDITEEELEEIARELVWEFISVNFEEIDEN